MEFAATVRLYEAFFFSLVVLSGLIWYLETTLVECRWFITRLLLRRKDFTLHSNLYIFFVLRGPWPSTPTRHPSTLRQVLVSILLFCTIRDQQLVKRQPLPFPTSVEWLFYTSTFERFGSPLPLSRKRVCLPMEPKGGGNTRLRVRERGEPIRTSREKPWHSRVYTLSPPAYSILT